MNLIELNSVLCGNYKEELKRKVDFEKTMATTEDINLFKSLLAIHDYYRDGFASTEVSEEFYEAYEMFRDMIPKEKQTDVFYATKMSYILEGVPSKLAYLLRKAIRSDKTEENLPRGVNEAILSIGYTSWGKFLKKGSLAGDLTVKDVIDVIVGRDCTLISDSVRKVVYEDYAEIYVQNVDRVVLVPKDIADQINSMEDLCNIQYKQGVGVCVGDFPLRIMNGRIGVTKNEFDLRECI